MKKIYRIEILAMAGSQEEYASYAISDFYENKDDAERELRKYDGMKGRQLEKSIGDTGLYVGLNVPQIEEYNLITSDK